MRLIIKSAVCLLMILLSGRSYGQPLNLETAVEYALKNNARVKQYNERAEQKEFQDLEAWGNFLPVIEIQGSLTHLNDDMSIDLNPIRDAMIGLDAATLTKMEYLKNPLLDPSLAGSIRQKISTELGNVVPSFVETFKKQDYKTATLTGIQPLFTGGRLYAAKSFASEEKRSARVELTKIRNEIIQETVNNYLSVVLMQNVVKTREDVINGIRRHRNNAEKLLKEGLIANYHLLRAEVAIADAERNFSDDQNKLELAILSLKHSIGADEGTDITISDTISYSPVSDHLDIYLNQASLYQPLLQLIELKKEAASSKYMAERAAFLPQLALFGKYEMYPEYLSSLEPRWAVGLQAKLNLFNGLKDYSRLQKAVHLEREVTYIEADAKRKVNLWVNKSYRDMTNARIRYEKLQPALKLAEENLRLNDKRFQSGMGTSLEVIDAQLSLEKNRIESLVSLYDYYRSLTELYLASGNPEEILKVWNKEFDQ